MLAMLSSSEEEAMLCWSLRIFQCPYLILVQEQFLDVEFQEIHKHFSSKTDVKKLGWMHHCPIEWTLDRCQHVQQEQNLSFCIQTRLFGVDSTVFLLLPLSLPRIVFHKNMESYKHQMLTAGRLTICSFCIRWIANLVLIWMSPWYQSSWKFFLVLYSKFLKINKMNAVCYYWCLYYEEKY